MFIKVDDNTIHNTSTLGTIRLCGAYIEGFKELPTGEDGEKPDAIIFANLDEEGELVEDFGGRAYTRRVFRELCKAMAAGETLIDMNDVELRATHQKS